MGDSHNSCKIECIIINAACPRAIFREYLYLENIIAKPFLARCINHYLFMEVRNYEFPKNYPKCAKE